MELEWDEAKRQRTLQTRHLDGVLCTYCFTWRDGRMRVISMRIANARERKKYQAGENPGHP